MALVIKSYVQAIRSTLEVVLCLRDFPSELVEKHNKPEVEIYDMDKSSKPLVLKKLIVARGEREKCLIESSINSVRVREIR